MLLAPEPLPWIELAPAWWGWLIVKFASSSGIDDHRGAAILTGGMLISLLVDQCAIVMAVTIFFLHYPWGV